MEVVLDKYIDISPDIRGGKPRISSTRIAVADIVVMHLRMGQSLEEISGRYELPLAAVYAAMAYYYDHRAAVDESIAADQAFVEAFKQDNLSPLHEKLKALQSG
ncbi:MAG: DUF433 domain-containing protein [Anaerolineales bacterium]|nr:DUF433 domain-containing protein [Anaerolineales bacterium]